MPEPRITRDRNDIETWADDHNAVPVREGDEIRLVPEDQMTTSHDRLEWETFHREVDEGDRVVTYYGDEGDREPFEVNRRESALEHADVDREEAEQRLIEGETITGTITETTVVEETVVEETTIESEVVDRETVDVDVVDVELLDRHCRACDVTADDAGFDYVGTYGTDRFLADDFETGTTERHDEYPFDVTVEIDEEWAVTIEQHDRYTVETDITDVDVTTTDEVEAHDREADIDVETVHRQLLGSDAVDLDIDARDEYREGELDTETYDIESEVTGDDVLTTYLDSRQRFRREISERSRLTTDVVEGELLDREIVSEEDLEAGLAERDVGGTATGRDVDETATGRDVDETVTETETSTAIETDREGRTRIEDEDEGKPVVNANGDKVGEVADVSGGKAYVDPHPSLGKKIMAKLGADEDDDYYLIDEDRIEFITDDEVHVSPGVADKLDDDTA